MRNLTVFPLSVIFAGVLAFAPAAAQAESDCARVTGQGHTLGVGPGSFAGTANLGINGVSATATVTTVLLGPPTATEDGTLHATTSHTFLVGGGSFTTLDNAVLSPTSTPGQYNLNTRAAIMLGSGSYANACGRLGIHGTIDLINPEATWRVRGKICTCS